MLLVSPKPVSIKSGCTCRLQRPQTSNSTFNILHHLSVASSQVKHSVHRDLRSGCAISLPAAYVRIADVTSRRASANLADARYTAWGVSKFVGATPLCATACCRLHSPVKCLRVKSCLTSCAPLGYARAPDCADHVLARRASAAV
jgi:hypothetical protein